MNSYIPTQKEIDKFRKKFCNFGLLLVMASWVTIYFYEFGIRTTAGDYTRKEVLSLYLKFELQDLFGGAFCPVFMALNGEPAGWFVIIIVLMAFFVFVLNKKIAIIMFVSSCILSNFATYGLEVRPVYMVGTFVAPLAFILCSALGTGAMVVSEVRSIIKDFLK